MSREIVGASGPVCEVIEQKCIGCGECVLACAYGAVALLVTEQGSKAVVNYDLCQGDGLCSSLCATGAIEFRDLSNREIFRQIDAAVGRA